MKIKFSKVVWLCVVMLIVFSIIFAGCADTADQASDETTDQVSDEVTDQASDEADSDSESEQDSSDESQQDGFIIGFSNFSVGNSWRVQMEAEFKYRAETLKSEGTISEYYMTNANGDATKQIADVRDLMTKNVDAIVITAASPDALVAVCEEAVSEGIVVINFEELMNSDNLTCKLFQDHTEYGQVCGEFLVEALGGEGNIVCLNGIAGTACDSERYEGAMEEINQSNIEVIAEANADWDYATAKAAVESFLAAYPEIDGVFSQGGAMTQAAIEAFVANGRDLVPMSGEANNGFLRIWKEYADQGFASVAPSSPTYQSAMALDLAIDALQGKELEDIIHLDCPTITFDEIDEYYNEDLPDSFWPVTHLPEEELAKLYEND